MEKEKYDVLKSVSLEKSGIIKCHVSDPIYKFCVINNVDNLADFIVVYKKQRMTMDSRYNFYYFDGVIDLINLVFFGEKLPEAKCMTNKINIFKNNSPYTRYAYVKEDIGFQSGRSDNKSLRKLGFNNNETKAILGHVLYLDKSVSIISAIKSCIDSFDFKKMSKEDEMFITKLYILSKYYDKNRDNIEKISSYEFYKAQEDLKEIKKLYKQMFKIQQKIIELSCDFEEKVQVLPQDEESVKKLLKTYQEFNCNEA